MPNAGDFRSQLVFHLTAALLNCAANNVADDNCQTSTLFGATVLACNTAAVCAPTTDATKAAQAACVSALDCLNNGGIPGLGGFCGTGHCSDNGLACTPGNKSACATPATATCTDAGSCHERNFTDYPDSPAGSQQACQAANKNTCDIFTANNCQ
jgi:hypothetical protein